MVTLTLLLVLFAVTDTHAIDCYECDHHDHNDHHDPHGPHDPHHHPTDPACGFFTCRNDEFCKLKVNQEHHVKGECHHLHGHGHGHGHEELNHCLHEMHHWCHDYRLATFHGECVFCCTTSDCVRQALKLPSSTTPAHVTSLPLTTTPVATATPVPTTTSVPNTTPVQTATTVRTATSSVCKVECADLSPDCATTPNACSLKFGPIACKKSCNLCPSNNTSTLTTVAVTAAPASTTPTGSVLPICTDQVKHHNCHLIPNVCNDSLASLLCPEFCGYCQRAPTTMKTTPAVLSTTASAAMTTTPAVLANTGTVSSCTDHDTICATKVDICTNPLGPQLCPKTCKSCSSASTVMITTPAVLSTTGTVSSCMDHAPICATSANICTDSLGPMLCPKTCKTCHVSATSALPTQTSSTIKLGLVTMGLQSNTGPAVTTTHTHSHRSCYQCGNLTKNEPCTLAEVALGGATPCASGSYCMTDVYNTRDGRMNIFKRCVGKTACRKQWFDETSDRHICVKYDSLNKVPDLYCHFCCTSDNCNTNILPPDSTLFWP